MISSLPILDAGTRCGARAEGATMSEQQREPDPERGPGEDQREDGVVIEPGAALDRDLERQGLEPRGEDGPS